MVQNLPYLHKQSEIMKLFRLLAAGFAALAIAGCGPGKGNPLNNAIADMMVEQNADVESFTVYKLTPQEEITLSQELGRRQKLFVTKQKTYRKKVEEYKAKGMKKNVAKNEEILRSTEDILSRIEAYRSEHAAQMDSVIYTVYRMDGCAKTFDKQKIEVRDYYVNVSPDGKVLAVRPSTENPYQHMGSAIPGYVEEIVAGSSL